MLSWLVKILCKSSTRSLSQVGWGTSIPQTPAHIPKHVISTICWVTMIPQTPCFGPSGPLNFL